MTDTDTEQPPASPDAPTQNSASSHPLSGAAAVVVIIAVIVLLVRCATGGAPTQAANAADSKPQHSAPASHANPSPAPPAPRAVPLRPPPSNGCVDKWCGKQLSYASLIVDVGRRTTNLPERAFVIAVATAMQESGLKVEATNVYPETKGLPNDTVQQDHDSVGIFQQRPSQGWGTPTDLMNPRTAASKFYAALQRKMKDNGWSNDDLSKQRLTDVAQAVQHSGYPGAYQQHEADAIKIVAYVQQFAYTGDSIGTTAQNDWFVMIHCKDPASSACQFVPYKLVQPVKDNKAAFTKRFPNVLFGDLGDTHHLGDDPKTNDDPLEDHSPVGQSCVNDVCNGYGWVYAMDLNGGDGFDLNRFARWLLDAVRAGKYPEVKYIITTIPGNKGVDGGRYYGIADVRNGWVMQPHDQDHDTHIHISFAPGKEAANSTIIADYLAATGT